MSRRGMSRASRFKVLVAGGAAAALSLVGCSTTDTSTKASSVSSATSTSAATATPSAGPAPSTTAAPPVKEVPSGEALYAQMRKSVAAATSVRIKGAMTNNGAKLTIDVAGDRDGKNSRALVNDGTGRAELLSAGGDDYVKADAAYWTKNGAAAFARVAAGKYVKVPAGSGVADAVKIGTLLDGVFTDLPRAGALRRVQETKLGGAAAYLLTDLAGTRDGKIYVSADGKANLLRIENTKGNPGVLGFTTWNAVPPFRAPPASQQIKIPGAS